MEKKRKVLRISAVFAIIAAALTLGFISLHQDRQAAQMSVSPAELFEENWVCETEEKAINSFPFTVSEKNISEITLTNRLPEIGESDELVLYRQYQYVEVYIEGECIFKSPYQDDDSLHTSVGTVITFVPLSPEYSGKQIQIYMRQINSASSIQIGSIYLCTRNSFILDYLKANIGKLIFISAMITGGIFLAVIYFLLRKKQQDHDDKMFWYLGIFAIQMAVWALTDSQIVQLLTGAYVTGGITSFAAFMLLPVPFMSFMDVICKKYNRALRVMQIVLCINFIVQILLYISGVFDLMNMLPATHALFLLAIIVIVAVTAGEVRTSRSYYIKGMQVGIFVMSVSGLLALAGYNMISDFSYMSVMLIGLLAFFLILSHLCFHKAYESIEAGTKARVYQKLAYIDVMTETGNRRAFEEALDRLDREEKEHDLTVIEFDLNNLKETNDVWGHKAGDRIITETARCIREAFSEKGRVYRIGGDEFTVLAVLKETELAESLGLLNKAIEKYNSKEKYSISAAAGWASVRDNPHMSVKELLKRADEKMYSDKEVKKYNKNEA